MKLLVSAAEISSDLHAAKLLEALKKILPPHEKLEAFGIGGSALKAVPEFEACVDARELLAMGSTEVLWRLPAILRALKMIEKEAAGRRPDLAIVVDYPDFHFRLAHKLKALHIPVIDYIPPKVWVWRKGRVSQLQALFAKLLCVFPFEEEFYQAEGVQCAAYVGNPLLDELPLGISKEEARAKFGILGVQGRDTVVITLMPGSRPAELKRHFGVGVSAVERAVRQLRQLGFWGSEQKVVGLIPLPPGLGEGLKIAKVEAGSGGGCVEWRVIEGDSVTALRASDAALVKSGTSTLEAGLLGCPHAVFYRASFLTHFIFDYFVRYAGPVGLVNLVGGWKQGRKPGDSQFLVREFLGKRATRENLSQELVSLFLDRERREKMQAEFQDLRAKLLSPDGRSPSEAAARAVLEVVR